MSELQTIIAALDALERQPASEQTSYEALDLMEQGVLLPGGLDAFAERYAGREDPLLLRPLTFFIARASSWRTQPTGAAAMTLVERMRCKDESSRSNLVTALQLLAMYDDIPGASDPPPRLAAFLEECLRGGPALRDAAVPAAASVLASGVRFTEDELGSLRAALEALRDEQPDYVAVALKAMGEPRSQ